MRKLFLTLFAMAAMAVNAKVEVVNLVAGGDLESGNTCVAVKSNVDGNTETTYADPVEGIGKDGSKGISVVAVHGATYGWDAQLWLVLSEALPEGTSYTVKFDYKASSAVSVGTQSHGEPGSYQHWAAIGNVDFGTEWKKFTSTVEVTSDMAGSNGLKSIAFNLSDDTDNPRENDITFYIDNVVITYEKQIIEEGTPVIKTLTDLNILGTNVKKENDGQFADCPADQIAVITGHKVEQTWDVQYWIGLSTALSKNTPFKVSFDYKASADATVDTQTHAAPGNYLHWACIGNVNFTTDWQTYSYSGTAQAANMQSIAFNLAQSADDVTYEIKNVAVTADITINPGNASTSVANNATISRFNWEGLTLSYPAGNEAILSALGINATMVAKKAYLYEDGVETPVASEELTVGTALDQAVLFAGAALKANTKYNVVIPEVGMQLLADNGDCYWYNNKEITLSFKTKAVLDDVPSIAYSEAALDGTPQYLYNVETSTFLYKGNDWGTRSTADAQNALLIALEANGETGTYRLLNKTTNNAFDCDGGNSVWVDGQNRTGDGNWTVTANGDGTYTLANTNAGEQKWGVKKDLSDTRFYFNTDDETYANVWAFISEADFDAYKVNAAEYLAALAQKNLDDKNKAALAAKKALLEGTNIYDEAGYNAYKSTYETELAAVNAGGYTGTVTNPNSTTGWHASQDYNFLLTPWKIADVDCNGFDAGLYMNTWSTEGVTDGSNFLVPFFEYWTGDSNSLGATSLNTTVSGLEAGKMYKATAWARVRLNNNSVNDQAYGINFQAGNGTPADVCLGEAYGQMRVMEVEALGKADEDGNLKVAFNVAADNNISWLSYKNVNVVEAKVVETGIEDGEVVKDVDTFEITFGGEMIMPTGNEGADITVVDEAGEVVATITQEELQQSIDESCLDEETMMPVKSLAMLKGINLAPGNYTINIPAGAFYVGEDMDPNDLTVLRFTIAPRITVTELQVAKLEKIELTYGTNRIMSPTLDLNANLTLTDKNGKVIETITQQQLVDALDDTCLKGKKIVKNYVVLSEAITTVGEYTLNIPAGAFYLDNDEHVNEAVSFVINVVSESGEVSDATAISNVKSDALNIKFMKNGKVVIVRNGKTYNVAGQIVK